MAVEVEYQKALYDRLSAAVEDLGVVGVYDIAPQVEDGGDATEFPYIVIGMIFPVNDDTHTELGFQVTTRLHVHSRTGSMLECKTIQAKLYRLLHRQPLSLETFREYDLLREDTQCTPMGDGRVHGICEYLGFVEERVASTMPRVLTLGGQVRTLGGRVLTLNI